MSIPFQTTDEQKLHLADIIVKMKKERLDERFVAAAAKIAWDDQGAFDLMNLWGETSDKAERDEIVADIQDTIDDHESAPAQPTKLPYIRFDQLDDVAKQVLASKVKLRDLIDRHGGVSAVAKKAGIPQPSLSRMLKSPSIPRKATLYRLATAMNVSEPEIVKITEWSY